MSTQRLLPTSLLILALLAPGAAASLAEPAASPALQAPTSAPVAPGDEYWAAGFNLPGMNGVVNALAFGTDGSLYAGGLFTTAGGVAANHIARWDQPTSSWHPLGSGIAGDYSNVYALAVGPDGSLYAGGDFTTAGGVAANYIARWDGSTSSWHPLGNGMGGEYPYVYALAVGPDGSLYAGGTFTTAGGIAANYIARWDTATSSWHPLGNGMGGGYGYPYVYALAIGPDGSLYAGGGFTTAGEVTANYIARWDGSTSSWHPLGSGMNGWVLALAFGPDDSVYAGGDFYAAGGVWANNIARWDGTQWHDVGGGLSGETYAFVDSLAAGPDGSIYAGGHFTTAGAAEANYIARWDGSQWHPLGSGMEGYYGDVQALAVGPDGSLYAGGYFTTAGAVAATHIARWNGTGWDSLVLGNGMGGGNGPSFPPSVSALAAGPDGSLYAGGYFTTAGAVAANYIARWDGSQWHPLSSGMEGYPGAVQALAVGPDGSLYAGGDFYAAGGIAAVGIARWDGYQWHPLGSGMSGGLGVAVRALAFGPDGSLYVGGGFTTAGGVAASHIARWDLATSSWHPLGSGIEGGFYSAVYALSFGSDGSLYAGGEFSTAGGVAANGIARWDGAQWHPLGSGMAGGDPPPVYALAFGPNDSLYVGGKFTTAGGVAASRIARWDGFQWHVLGSGMGGEYPFVGALAFGPGGSLYAGGSFTTAGSGAANSIARWDGALWHPLGSGINGNVVRALAKAQDGSLYAGGSFARAGDKLSSNIAQWTGSVNPQWVWHKEAEDVPRSGSMQRGTDSGGASACYYVYDTVAWSGSSITFDVIVPYTDNYTLWARAMGLDWDKNSFWVSVDSGPFFHYEIGQFGGQWTWGWEQVHEEGQPVTPFALTAGQHTIVFSSREPLSRLDAVVLVNRADYVPTQFTPCGTTPTPTASPTSTTTECVKNCETV